MTCPAVSTVGNLNASLDPGESITCTASYTITQADLNSGSVTNVATAHAGGTNSNQDTETVTAVQTKTLSLVKSATPSTYSTVGQSISYSYLVTNTGNVRLAGPVTVADDKATVTCPAVSTVGNNDSFLDPGEAVTCTASYTITQADLNSGSVTNVAKASAAGIDSNEDTETVTAVQTEDAVAGQVGDAVDLLDGWSVDLLQLPGHQHRQRASRRPGHGDRRQGDGQLPGREHGRQPRQLPRSGRGGHLHRLLHDHAGRPQHRLGHQRGQGKRGRASTRTRTPRPSPRCGTPALSLVKTASPSTYSTVGQSISYSYLVTNTGNVSLAGPVTVTDDKATVTCPAVSTVGNLNANLDPGESITCTATYSITQADLNSGSVTNVATAHAGGTELQPGHRDGHGRPDADAVAGQVGDAVDLLDGWSVDLLQLSGHQHGQRAPCRAR